MSILNFPRCCIRIWPSCRRPDAKIIFDLSTSYERHTETETLLRNIDYAFMSYPQRDEHVKEADEKISEPRPHFWSVATFGEDGSLVWDGKEFYSAGITPAEKVVNTVGAGGRLLPGRLYAWNYDRKIHPRNAKKKAQICPPRSSLCSIRTNR